MKYITNTQGRPRNISSHQARRPKLVRGRNPLANIAMKTAREASRGPSAIAKRKHTNAWRGNRFDAKQAEAGGDPGQQ